MKEKAITKSVRAVAAKSSARELPASGLNPSLCRDFTSSISSSQLGCNNPSPTRGGGATFRSNPSVVIPRQPRFRPDPTPRSLNKVSGYSFLSHVHNQERSTSSQPFFSLYACSIVHRQHEHRPNHRLPQIQQVRSSVRQAPLIPKLSEQ